MAFNSTFGTPSFGNAGTAGAAETAVQTGPDLPEIQTQELDFTGFNGETKVRLLPQAWPEDALPPPTSSLLSVSQKTGLLAAAGPNSIIIAKTAAVRETLMKKDASGNVRDFDPQLTLPVGTRVSQVAFSSDGSCLAISAEAGGGLAVYDVQAMLQGSTSSAFEMPTNGTSLRALVPNPDPTMSELFAIVTTKGELLLADMKARAFRQGKNGQVLKEGVSCVVWSTKGKALLAGLGNGTIAQLRADAEPMAEFPRPPGIQGSHHVSALSWLENDLVLAAYTPSNTSGGMPDPTDYFIIERRQVKNANSQNPPTYTFSKLPEVSGPFGMDRNPASQFMVRLNKFHKLDHVVFVVSTAGEDVGIFAKSSAALAPDAPTNTFVAATPASDSRRAQLPMKEDLSSGTSPIGMVIDLSSSQKVVRPTPSDEFDESPPLPGLLILNNDGILAGWWIVYTDAIRQGISYPGLVAPGTQDASSLQPQERRPQPASAAMSSSSFGGQATPKPAFGQPSFGGPATPAFGTTSTPQPSFGSTSSIGGQVSSTFGSSSSGAAFGKPAFGSTSSLGFNKPAFGSPSLGGSAFGSKVAESTQPNVPTFGSSSALGSNAFGAPSHTSNQTSTPAFGAPTKPSAFGTSSALSGESRPSFGSVSKTAAFGNTSSTSPFAQAGNAKPPGSSGGFASPASGGLGAFGKSPENPFASKSVSPFSYSTTASKPPNPFASSSSSGIGGTPSQSTANPFASSTAKSDKPSQGLFSNTGGFNITSTFAEKATKAEESDSTGKSTGGSLFGGEFGAALSSTANDPRIPEAQDHEEDMEDEGDENATPRRAPESPQNFQSTTPQETPGFQKVMDASGIEGGKALSHKTFTTSTNTFPMTSHGPVQKSQSSATQKLEPPKPKETAKEAPKGEDKGIRDVPLPPEAQSKDSYTPGNSSASSVDTSQGIAESAPLPPDFTKTPKAPSSATQDVPPLPPDTSKVIATQSGKQAEPIKPAPKPSTKAVDDAPLPPDFLIKKPGKKQEETPPLPEDKSLIDDEGSGVDVANELSTEGSPESSFGSKSSLGMVFSGKGASKFKAPPPKSVFDDVKKTTVPFFSMPPPTQEPDSPRSPSPIRQPKSIPPVKQAQTSSAASRSVSGPAVGKGGGGMRKPTQGRMPPPQKVVQPMQSSAFEKAAEKAAGAAEASQASRNDEQEQQLSDQEDEYIRAELETPIQPTTKLAGFIAHQDYTGGVNKDGIPGQIEVVYRDANSMVDTLGLNLRSIKAWVAGQSATSESSPRQIDDLEETEDWTMIEMAELENMQHDLYSQLNQGKVSNVQVTHQLCYDLLTELGKLKKRNEDIARTVETLQFSAMGGKDTHEDLLAPLSTVQAEARQDLRRTFADFRSNLAAAEEGVALLRAKLAAARSQSSSSETERSSQQVPTVEAIERTIRKMTSMIEHKSANLDVLISQTQKLGLFENQLQQRPRSGTAGSNRGLLIQSSGRRSRSGSPFESPAQSRPGSSSAKNASPLRLSAHGAASKGTWTPRSSKLGNSLILTEDIGRLGLGFTYEEGITDEEIARYTEKLKQRKEATRVLKQALGTGDPRVRTLDDV